MEQIIDLFSVTHTYVEPITKDIPIKKGEYLFILSVMKRMTEELSNVLKYLKSSLTYIVFLN